MSARKPPQTLSALLAEAVDRSAVPTAVTQKGKMIYANAAFESLCGAWRGKDADALFAEDSVDLFRWMTKPGRRESDKTILTVAQGKAAGREALAQVWPLNDDYSLFSVQKEFSPLRVADMDELTGLPNRRKANLLLNIEGSNTRKHDGFCVAMGDIDHFKQINDTHGHHVGDDALRHIAGVMRASLRETDWAARWGGEEFLVFISGGDLITGMQPIGRIHQRLNEAPFPGPPQLPITMSFGVASSHTGDADIAGVINKADSLLYEAKRAGRNRILCEEKDDIVWFAQNISQAIEDGRVLPLYRPLVSAKNKTVAVVVTHGLQDETPEEAQKMLAAAGRLRLRFLADNALLEGLERALPPSGSVPFFVPVSDAMMSRYWPRLKDLLTRHSYLCAGLRLQEPLAAEHMSALVESGLPLALLDFSPANAPLPLLAKPATRHLVYENPAQEAAAALPLIPPHIVCHAHNDEARAHPRFVGVAQNPAVPRWQDAV